MKMKFQHLVTMGLVGVFSQTILAEPTPNLDTHKKEIVQYHDSGEYEKELTAIAEKAIAYINQRVAENRAAASPQKLAIVFDVDETVLSNYQYLRDKDFAFSLDTIHAHQPEGTAPALKPIQDVYNVAVRNNIDVFFITGRTKPIEAATIRNLKTQGYGQWKGLILKPDGYKEKTAAVFKTAGRKHITEEGYNIIASFGDQESDFTGGYADRLFKLPNPYYFVP